MGWGNRMPGTAVPALTWAHWCGRQFSPVPLSVTAPVSSRTVLTMVDTDTISDGSLAKATDQFNGDLDKIVLRLG